MADHARRSLPDDRVHFGLAAASGLVRLFGRAAEDVKRTHTLAMVLDRFDHVALLADELDAIYRRREIAARGNVLTNSFTIRNALNASADGASFH